VHVEHLPRDNAARIARMASVGTLGYNVAQQLIKERPMAANEVVRARIDGQVKEEAAAVLATMGLTVSDAFRLLLIRVAQEKALPFEPLVPNAKTIRAMKAARRGKVASFRTVKGLMADLHADD
jgi:DNA-damage-inducible protein J